MLLCLLALFAAVATAAASTEFDLGRYHGRVVIVDFWASWCKPCRESIPWLNELQARYGPQGLVIIGINVDAERRDADRFLREVPTDFEVLFDPGGKLAQRFDVPGMPATYLFDRSGVLAENHLGFRQAQRAGFEARVSSLLSQSAKSATGS